MPRSALAHVSPHILSVALSLWPAVFALSSPVLSVVIFPPDLHLVFLTPNFIIICLVLLHCVCASARKSPLSFLRATARLLTHLSLSTQRSVLLLLPFPSHISNLSGVYDSFLHSVALDSLGPPMHPSDILSSTPRPHPSHAPYPSGLPLITENLLTRRELERHGAETGNRLERTRSHKNGC